MTWKAELEKFRVAKYDELQAEIARLQTENEHLISRGHDCEEMLQDKEAEIARLRNERDVAVKERSNAREQVYAANDTIDRLRAALGEIAKWGQTGYCAFDIARKALADKEEKSPLNKRSVHGDDE